MRLFFAIELPQALRTSLSETIERLRPLSPDSKWVVPEKVHLTLAFLGHLDPTLVPALDAALEEATARLPPFELSYGGGGSFGGRSRPRVLFVAVGGQVDGLAGLQSSVCEAATKLKIPLEDRAYHPHLTLARARHPRGDAGLSQCAVALEGVAIGAQQVTEAVLFQSHTSSKGATYEAMARGRLRGASR